MKIIITGGAGCLGSNIVEYLLPQGHQITIIDNFSTGKREIFPESINGLEIVEGNINDYTLMKKIFEKTRPEIVIHSAASYKDPDDFIEDTETNIKGTINVLRSSEEFSAKKIINFQTALCYGRPSEIPIREDAPTAPFTSYGVSKTAGEKFLFLGNIPVISLRLANICGPRLSIGPIPTFYKRLKENKGCFCSEAVRDFLDMSDFLAIIDILIHRDGISGIYNVSTGEGKSIKDVFDEVSNYLGIEFNDVPVKPVGDDDVKTVILDPAKIEKDLGWKAKVGFREIIENQLSWYDNYGVNDIFSHLKNSE
jgi:UDP-glucose 4-epimerase